MREPLTLVMANPQEWMWVGVCKQYKTYQCDENPWVQKFEDNLYESKQYHAPAQTQHTRATKDSVRG